MFKNFNLYIVFWCALFITATALAQPAQDSTNLQKMKESDFKVMDNANPLTVLTRADIKETFAGLRATVDNSGDYSIYEQDLRYKVIEHAGGLAIQKYTPKLTCSKYRYREGRSLCETENEKYAGKTSIMCHFAKGTKLCTHTLGGSYELTLGGLLMGESYIACWRERIPIYGMANKCAHKQHPPRVYVWDTPSATE
ncbi:MAG: hypothetical protein GDA45_06335 [Chromatiales bacterium]|nr:hypothetical protein [Chromatiales bacterium]